MFSITGNGRTRRQSNTTTDKLCTNADRLWCAAMPLEPMPAWLSALLLRGCSHRGCAAVRAAAARPYALLLVCAAAAQLSVLILLLTHKPDRECRGGRCASYIRPGRPSPLVTGVPRLARYATIRSRCSAARSPPPTAARESASRSSSCAQVGLGLT